LRERVGAGYLRLRQCESSARRPARGWSERLRVRAAKGLGLGIHGRWHGAFADTTEFLLREPDPWHTAFILNAGATLQW
jgi:hypothetical protein